jgi:hypothetical protein
MPRSKKTMASRETGDHGLEETMSRLFVDRAARSKPKFVAMQFRGQQVIIGTFKL